MAAAPMSVQMLPPKAISRAAMAARSAGSTTGTSAETQSLMTAGQRDGFAAIIHAGRLSAPSARPAAADAPLGHLEKTCRICSVPRKSVAVRRISVFDTPV
ncbi:hypothetical protein GCM10007301_29900 [Azorhizobium oxalatiphilum]|uniref:Uncharacterized protein n=1 Tax=Azorhizobium oxalatiphilum TaxID=980631 RepID=A0A917C1T5_9HYPH|nr:hypothetical protein GCM10007301_29900 [Azorhizobium oxalatiphilum]